MKIKGIDVQKTVKNVKKLLSDNAPAILTTAGAIGAAATAYLGVRAGVKAGMEIKEIEKDLENDERSAPAKFADRASKTWKHFVPVSVAAVGTIGCIVMANKISLERAAGLTAALAVSDKALGEYKSKVLETVGAKKVDKIEDEIAQDRVKKNPVRDSQVLVIGNGNALFYDMSSDRYFRSTMEDVNQALNSINMLMASDGMASLNDWYVCVGLEKIAAGDALGWAAYQDVLELRRSGVIAEDGTPAMAIGFNISPYSGYDA